MRSLGDPFEIQANLNTPRGKNILGVDKIEKLPRPNPSGELGSVGPEFRGTVCIPLPGWAEGDQEGAASSSDLSSGAW